MQAVWFVLSFLTIYSSILFYKKSEKRLNIFVWGIMSFIFILTVHAFVASIINLIKLPINLWSIGFFNFVIGIVIWVKNIKSKKKQLYYFDVSDLIYILCMVIVVGYVCLQQFGTNLYINYESVDGATHFRMALEVLQNQKISKMFFAPLNNALFLGIFAPFCKATELYRFYILSDVFMLFLGGSAFWSLIRNKADTKTKRLLAITISLIYMMGYPRNSLLYGFNYLGVSIILIIFLAWAIQCYFDEIISENSCIVLINLGCLGLGLCYSLFVPVVYVSLALSVFRYFWNKDCCLSKQEKIKKSVILDFKLFLLPTIIVLYYSFFSFFGTENTGNAIASGISAEGGIYRELFSNFIFWIPFAIYAMLMIIHKHMDDLVVLYAIFLIIFMLYLGIAVLMGKTSTYYFYKNYFFLSAVIFYLVYCAISMLIDLSWQLVLSYLLVYFTLMVCAFFNIEGRIQARNFLLVPTLKATYFFDIYEVDRILLNNMNCFGPEKLDICNYCYDNYPENEYECISFLGNPVDYNIYRGITMRLEGMDTRLVKCSTADDKNVTMYEVFEQGYEYLLSEFENADEQPIVFMCSDEKTIDKIKEQYVNKLDIVFENTNGFVAMPK